MKVVGEGGGGSIITSISGTVATSQQGTVTVVQGTNPWQTSISGTITTSLSGTVPVTQSTSPWLTSQSGTVTVANAFALDATLTGGNVQVQGNVSDSGTNSGNPILIGGLRQNGNPNYQPNHRGAIAIAPGGSILATLTDSTAQTFVGTQQPTQDATNLGGQGGIQVTAAQFAFNGTTWDRARSAAIGDAAAVTGLPATVPFLFNGTSYDRSRSVGIGDAASTGIPTSGSYVFNGTTWDRLRGTSTTGSLTSISGTVPTTLSGSPTVVPNQNVGRSQVFLYVDQATGTTGETAASIVGSKAQASLASSTTYVVSAGKTLRIQAATITVKDTSTVVSGTRWRIRVGSNSTTGPVLLALEAGTEGAISIDSSTESLSIPDGLEVSSGTSLSFSHVDTATTLTTSIGVTGFEY